MSTYAYGAETALIKLGFISKQGVSETWVRDRIQNAVRKGLPQARVTRSVDNLRDIGERHWDNLANRVYRSEPHPLRPDLATGFYTGHNLQKGNTAHFAANHLENLNTAYPIGTNVPKNIDVPFGPPTHALRNKLRTTEQGRDVYGLRQSLPDVSEAQIEAARVGDYGPKEHPRNLYNRKMLQFDKAREQPVTQQGRAMRESDMQVEEKKRAMTARIEAAIAAEKAMAQKTPI